MPEFQMIPVSAIDPEDHTYRVTRAGDIPALALSICAVGLACPITVIRKAADMTPEQPFSIVAGFRRFQAVQDLKRDTVPCRVFAGNKTEDCARLAIADNAFGRDLESGELVRAVRLLAGHMDADTIADQSQAIFNIRLNRGYVHALIKIGNLGEKALGLLDSGQLAIKAAKVLAAMPREDADPMLSLFARIRVSSGKQMEILTWTREICAREGILLDNLLGEQPVLSALDTRQGNQDLGVAGNRVRSYFFTRRFPELDQARQRAAELVRDLRLPKNLRLTLPENFESTACSFSLNVSSMSDYRAGLKILTNIETYPSLKQILDR